MNASQSEKLNRVRETRAEAEFLIPRLQRTHKSESLNTRNTNTLTTEREQSKQDENQGLCEVKVDKVNSSCALQRVSDFEVH